MGVSNICSSVVGGLTIIPGGVKSRACIEGGGRTLWANFYNAVFLVIYLAVATSLINRIPYAALAAVLIHTGYKLCRPTLWKHTAHLGREQLGLFSATVLVTLLTDLLVGIAFGVILKLLMSVLLISRPVQGLSQTYRFGPLYLFRNPVGSIEREGETTCHLRFERPLVCFNSIQVADALANLPPEVRHVVLHVTPGVVLIDHTSCDLLLQFAEDFVKSGRGTVEIQGLEAMQSVSPDRSSLRLAPLALMETDSSRISRMTRLGLGLPREQIESAG